jgi:transposase-like protein
MHDVVIRLGSVQHYCWRVVDQDKVVSEVHVQRRLDVVLLLMPNAMTSPT